MARILYAFLVFSTTKGRKGDGVGVTHDADECMADRVKHNDDYVRLLPFMIVNGIAFADTVLMTEEG